MPKVIGKSLFAWHGCMLQLHTHTQTYMKVNTVIFSWFPIHLAYKMTKGQLYYEFSTKIALKQRVSSLSYNRTYAQLYVEIS